MLEELHKSWKHLTAHLKELHQRKEEHTDHNHNNSTKCEIGQPVMVNNHTCHTFKPKYLLNYKVLKILNDSTLLLITPNGKERITNIYNVKKCSTTELVKNAWNSFLSSIKTKHQNFNYSLRCGPNSKI